MRDGSPAERRVVMDEPSRMQRRVFYTALAGSVNELARIELTRNHKDGSA